MTATRVAMTMAALAVIFVAFQNCAEDFDKSIYITSGTTDGSSTGNQPAPELPITFNLSWSYAGNPSNNPNCVVFAEPTEPAATTWTDNYLCADKPLGLQWSSSGTIPGLKCYHIHEGADPHSWDNNYLCSDKELNLRWSPAGPVDGMTCLNIDEPSDQAGTWGDNYLCYPSANPQVIVAAPVLITAPQSYSTTYSPGFFEDFVTISVVAYGRNLTYKWYFTSQFGGGEVVLTGQTGSAVTFNPATPSDSGTYRVVVSNSAGSFTQSAVLTVEEDNSFN